jgi:alanine-glyoxylate transaminase/serine-glyoxylate transaminase/serine-pyruvate transaminase
MLLGAIAGAELAMLDVGVKIEPGSGVAAAQNYWRKHAPALQSKTEAAKGKAA